MLDEEESAAVCVGYIIHTCRYVDGASRCQSRVGNNIYTCRYIDSAGHVPVVSVVHAYLSVCVLVSYQSLSCQCYRVPFGMQMVSVVSCRVSYAHVPVGMCSSIVSFQSV